MGDRRRQAVSGAQQLLAAATAREDPEYIKRADADWAAIAELRDLTPVELDKYAGLLSRSFGRPSPDSETVHAAQLSNSDFPLQVEVFAAIKQAPHRGRLVVGG